MKFKSAYLKLTLYYVLIIMFISIVFSVSLYQLSSREIDRGLRRQGIIIQNLPNSQSLPAGLSNFEQIRLDQFKESSDRLKFNLILINLMIFVSSGWISYLLAKKTLQPIKEMVEMQSRFTADASHELRTPLTAMKTEIEVRLRGKLIKNKEVKDLLESNLEEIGKLETLSNELLKLANYENRKNRVFEINQIDEIINSAFNKVKVMAVKKHLKFDFKIEKLPIKSDKQSLIDLFTILMDNAIKYSPANQKVEIEAQKAGRTIIIKITDYGSGIKEADMPQIFDRFYRADVSRSKEKVAGYGLGLSIAKEIAELHRGTIKVESVLKKGSTFEVTLPI